MFDLSISSSSPTNHKAIMPTVYTRVKITLKYLSFADLDGGDNDLPQGFTFAIILNFCKESSVMC